MPNKPNKISLHDFISCNRDKKDYIQGYYGTDIATIRKQELLYKLSFCRDALQVYSHIDVMHIDMHESGAILTIEFSLPTYVEEITIYVTIPIEEHSRPAYCIFKQICNTVKDKVKEIMAEEKIA